MNVHRTCVRCRNALELSTTLDFFGMVLGFFCNPIDFFGTDVAGFHGPQPAGPRSGVQVTSSGSLGPPWPGPPAQATRSSQGSTPRFRKRPVQSGSLAHHRVGMQHPRSLTAAPGSTVHNRPAPLGSSSYTLGFIGSTLVRRRPACPM